MPPTFPNPTLNTTIEYDLVILGNNRYRYIYTITNGTSDNTNAIQLFDIHFDASLYDENTLIIKTPSPPATDWTETLLFSVTGVAPIYDAFSLTGIAENQSVTGFAIEFTWLGSGIPLDQPFDIYTPNLVPLESGTTSLRQVINNPPPVNPPPIFNPPLQNGLQNVPLLSPLFFYLLNISLFILCFFYQNPILSRTK